MLKRGGSPERAKGVPWFFQEQIQSQGWYTADLRTLAHQMRRQILAQQGLGLLVADRLFTGCVLEEEIFAVFLLQELPVKFVGNHFRCL